MRIFLFTCLAVLLINCNSSSSKKETNETKDDTAGVKYVKGNMPGYAFTEPVKVSLADIPSSIKITGTPEEIWKWNDEVGANILITSFISPYDDKSADGEEGQTASVHAVHFVFCIPNSKSDEYCEFWKMDDVIRSCLLDITCAFIKRSTTITDLDKDGIAEVKLQYSKACRGDVSPADMILVMETRGFALKLKGMMWVKTNPSDKFTVTKDNVNLEKLPKKKDEYDQLMMSVGRYETEKDFAEAPPEFLSFAKTEWLKYVKERMGEEE